jgi:hypothetical protein
MLAGCGAVAAPAQRGADASAESGLADARDDSGIDRDSGVSPDLEAGLDSGVSPDSEAGLDSDANSDCFTSCAGAAATLSFSCLAVVTSVQTSGPCVANACAPKGDASCAQAQVTVVSTGAGVCHAALTLEGGFAYSADVTFVAAAASGCCPAGIVPTQSTYDVAIPTASCVADSGTHS